MIPFILLTQPLLAAIPIAAPVVGPIAEPIASYALDDAGEFHGGGPYLRLSGGLVTTKSSDGPDESIDFNEGYLLAVGFGQRMSSGDQALNFDLELEAVWDKQEAGDQGPIEAVSDLAVLGGFLNGMLDFRLADRLSIYAGGGIGAAWVDVETNSNSINDFNSDNGPNFAWQAKAGLEWRTSQSVALFVGYRFLNIDDTQIEDGIGSSSFDLQTEQHTLEVGLRFGF